MLTTTFGISRFCIFRLGTALQDINLCYTITSDTKSYSTLPNWPNIFPFITRATCGRRV